MIKTTSSMKKIVALAAGGTGGHMFPAMSVAAELLMNNYKVILVTDEKFNKYKMNFKEILSDPNFSVEFIRINSDTRKSMRLLRLILPIICSIIKLISFLRRNRVKAVVGFGSYVSFPVIIGGLLTGAKCLIHEQNASMGLANRISLFFCKHCMVGFPETDSVPFLLKKRVIFTGIPVRESIRSLYDKNTIDAINYDAFFLIYDRINILIIGGSQGARSFKTFVPQALSMLPDSIKRKLDIHHQCHLDDITEVRNEYIRGSLYAVIAPFFNNVHELMSRSHLMISRSGASTVAEITAIGTPSILIPYPLATDDHQRKNAMYLSNNGASILLDQEDITITKLSHIISNLVQNEGDLPRLSHNAKHLAKIDAHKEVVRIIDRCLGVLASSGIETKSKTMITHNVGIS